MQELAAKGIRSQHSGVFEVQPVRWWKACTGGFFVASLQPVASSMLSFCREAQAALFGIWAICWIHTATQHCMQWC